MTSLNGTALGAMAALAGLTNNEREAFLNRELLHFTLDRSARSMGISKQRVSQLLQAAEAKLGHGATESDTRWPRLRPCSGCGGDKDNYTHGCKRCASRRYDRQRTARWRAA